MEYSYASRSQLTNCSQERSRAAKLAKCRYSNGHFIRQRSPDRQGGKADRVPGPLAGNVERRTPAAGLVLSSRDRN